MTVSLIKTIDFFLSKPTLPYVVPYNGPETRESLTNFTFQREILDCIETEDLHYLWLNLSESGPRRALRTSSDVGEYPLHTAVSIANQDSTVVRMLLEADAEINQKDAGGWTPLNIAASKCHTFMIKFLIMLGGSANLNVLTVDEFHLIAQPHQRLYTDTYQSTSLLPELVETVLSYL